MILSLKSEGRIVCFSPSLIEIKRSSAPSISPGFYTACEDVKASKRFIVYGGNDQFLIGEDITVMPLKKFMKLLIQKVDDE